MHTNPNYQGRANDADADRLQRFLRAEMAAVETYTLALQSFDHVGLHRSLQEILASHSQRVELIRTQIAGLGAEPLKSSGVWGAFAKVFQAGADLLGDRAAMAALEQGEDHLSMLYDEEGMSFDVKIRRIVQDQIVPAQRHTSDVCRMLKSYTKSPS